MRIHYLDNIINKFRNYLSPKRQFTEKEFRDENGNIIKVPKDIEDRLERLAQEAILRYNT